MVCFKISTYYNKPSLQTSLLLEGKPSKTVISHEMIHNYNHLNCDQIISLGSMFSTTQYIYAYYLESLVLHICREKVLSQCSSSLKQCLKSVHKRFVSNKEKHYIPVPDTHNGNGNRRITRIYILIL